MQMVERMHLGIGKAGTTSGLSGGTITPTAYSFSTTARISTN